MNDLNTKEAILAALEAGYAGSSTIQKLRTSFILEGEDHKISNLGLDSLGLMEFCISLEVNGIIAISPEEALKLDSLIRITEFIKGSKIV